MRSLLVQLAREEVGGATEEQSQQTKEQIWSKLEVSSLGLHESSSSVILCSVQHVIQILPTVVHVRICACRADGVCAHNFLFWLLGS